MDDTSLVNDIYRRLDDVEADLDSIPRTPDALGGGSDTGVQPGTPATHVQAEGSGAAGSTGEYMDAGTILELRRRVGAGPGTAVPHPSGIESSEEAGRHGVIWETEYTKMSAIQDNVGSQGSRRAILCSDHHHALSPGVGLRWNGTDLEVHFADGEDVACETAFGTDLFSAATPGGDARLGRNIYQYADDAYSVHYLYRFNGTWAAKTKVLSGQNLAWMGFGGYHGGGGFASGAWIGAVAKGDYDAVADIPTELQFWTAPDGGGSRKVATINENGILELMYGGQLATDKQLQFRDSGIFAYSPADGVLGFSADGGHYRLYEPSSGGNYINLVVPGLSGNCSYTLPSALPASDKFLQSTSGGVMTWETPAAGDSYTAGDGTDKSGSFTCDGTWHDLDLSSETSGSAKLIFVCIEASASPTPGDIWFRPDGGSTVFVQFEVADTQFLQVCAAIPAASGVIEYNCTSSVSIWQFRVAGYFE